MLLYQMSQWMDERRSLKSALRSDDAEAAYTAQHQIQELEDRLYGQARQWMASYQAPTAIVMPGVPYEPPLLQGTEPDFL